MELDPMLAARMNDPEIAATVPVNNDYSSFAGRGVWQQGTAARTYRPTQETDRSYSLRNRQRLRKSS